MKDIRVRVYTLLSGPCTNYSMMMSTNYTELVQRPPNTGKPEMFVVQTSVKHRNLQLLVLFTFQNLGIVGTEVQDFVCVYHNMNYLECSWGRNPKVSAKSEHNLYFWYVTCHTFWLELKFYFYWFPSKIVLMCMTIGRSILCDCLTLMLLILTQPLSHKICSETLNASGEHRKRLKLKD